ncbi:mRNA export factor ICP27 [Cacatuid alphaherpesvirus 2]|uniref:mRNA export factor ICP27 n=1 Tax=Cacatuid alphaherpesvirus 2 TaxID=2604840 RepID=A0A5B9R3W3_9ALPH|nr:mRNA export factor ICP27 [Cacatuid alphaherpesvirus 2]QEG54059.1 mRNA export factor ICP27 [Cacatuid alphaherpesvirus 2]
MTEPSSPHYSDVSDSESVLELRADKTEYVLMELLGNTRSPDHRHAEFDELSAEQPDVPLERPRTPTIETEVLIPDTHRGSGKCLNKSRHEKHADKYVERGGEHSKRSRERSVAAQKLPLPAAKGEPGKRSTHRSRSPVERISSRVHPVEITSHRGYGSRCDGGPPADYSRDATRHFQRQHRKWDCVYRKQNFQNRYKPYSQQRARTPEKWSGPPAMAVPLKFTRGYWERNRDLLRRPVWRKFYRPSQTPADGGDGNREVQGSYGSAKQPQWLETDKNAAKFFEKAKDAFGGMESQAVKSLFTENRDTLYIMTTAMVDDDDCVNLDQTRQKCFPTLEPNGALPHEGASVYIKAWSDLCERASFLKARWNSQPGVARFARTTRGIYLSNCSLNELLEACDETLTWMLWHQFEDEALMPHDPIFSNIYLLCQGLTTRLGPVLHCHLGMIKSPLADQSRTTELPLESATCPLTLVLIFGDRFSRAVYNIPHVSLMSHKTVDREGVLRTLYLPGMCAKKIPLVLAQHANVCRKEECRLVCAQLLGEQYTVGKFFHCNLYW